MATVTKRKWWARGATGHRIRKVAWGYTVVLAGEQVKSFREGWTKEDAEAALAARFLALPPAPEVPAPKTFAQVAQEYLAFKRGKGKRSIRQDEQLLQKLQRRLGAETPIPDITAQRIAQYDRERSTETSRQGRPISPSTVNRELAVLKHLLNLAEEWGYIVKRPKIRMSPEPEGRVVWLEAPEEEAFLQACRASRTKHLAWWVIVAFGTGMRYGENMGLTRDRVDRARGVLMLERTKSGSGGRSPCGPRWTRCSRSSWRGPRCPMAASGRPGTSARPSRTR